MRRSFYPTHVEQAVVRSNALFTIITALLSVGTGSWIPPAVLVVDFTIRGFLHPRWSPFSFISVRILRMLRSVRAVSEKKIFFPPKQFAARVGLAFSVTATVLFFFGQVVPAIIVVSTLALFAALECFLNICMGCIVFNTFIAPHRRRRSFEMDR